MKNSLNYYLGNIEQPFLGYAADSSIRQNAASGGTVSAVLLYLLKKKKIGGALVCRQKTNNGKIDAEVFIARTPKEIISCQSSIYFYIPILSHLKEIKKFTTKLAIVGLPCQIKILRNLIRNDPDLEGKFFLIGLFCGHTSQKELLTRIINKRGIREEEVKKVIFRRGHWRGEMHIFLKDRSEIAFPFQYFSTYQNLFFYCDRRCLSCIDHTAECADISCGDVWSAKYKSHPVKHSLIIPRNKESLGLLRGMEKDQELILQTITPEEVFRIQKRSLILHKHIKARGVLGRWFGFIIPHSKKETARWQDYLAAGIVLSNVRLAESKIGKKLIFFIPRQIWFLYLVLLKLLTSF